MTWIIAAILAAGVAALARIKIPCNHRMYWHFDEATSRMYEACYCGERCQR
jgi:hypothetical protein